MKSLIFEQAQELAKTGQHIVPTKPRLWDRTVRLLDLQETSVRVDYYEKLGGRWKITEGVMKPRAAQNQKPHTELEVIGPIYGIDESDHGWVKRLKKSNPDAYERMLNWD